MRCKQEVVITTLHIKPEVGVPFPESDFSSTSLLERARLACNTINTLFPDSDDEEPSEEELQASRTAFSSLIGADKSLPPTDVAKFPTPALKHLDRLLSDYDKELVNSAVRIREYVKNKLLEESENPDGKIRIRALELLGKMKDVGLFTDRMEITYKAKSDEELMAELNRKLERFMGPAEIVAEEGNPALQLKKDDPEEDLSEFIASLPDPSA